MEIYEEKCSYCHVVFFIIIILDRWMTADRDTNKMDLWIHGWMDGLIWMC